MMHVPRHFLSVVAALGLALATAANSPAADPAAQVIEAAVQEVMAIVYAPAPTGQLMSVRVRPVLEKYFDFEYATRSAVGPGWRQFTPEQQAKTTQLFTDLVIRTYADRFEPGAPPAIAWGKPVAPADKRREVPSTITYEGKQYAVSYKLRETPRGWLVYDVVAENVSMIANYRAQFDELFKKGGADAVVRSLEENLAQASAAAAPAATP